MRTIRRHPVPLLLCGVSCLIATALVAGQGGPRRNVIIFVADGLRHGSVNATDTPALWAVRQQGVHFADSHSVFPTFTMANASAIATGHGLGDTGVFSNTIWPGFVSFDTGAFGLVPGTPVPFLENDRTLADMNGHFGGNFLGDTTLLALARAQGYRTAAIGKLGPTAGQDVSAIAPVDDAFPSAPAGLIIDDAMGTATAAPVPPAMLRLMIQAGLAPEAPARTNGFAATSQYNNGYAGDRTKAGTVVANVVQQQWFADVTTQVVLPAFTASADTPFAFVFWSRDPDGTQHGHGDSLGALTPGVNGNASRNAARNADRNLQQILAWLDAHPAVKANTNLFVTSDHGVATISRREIDRGGRMTSTEASKHDYVDATGTIDTLKGTLPQGFLAIDLATGLQMNLFDPDQHPEGSRLYPKLRIDAGALTWQHPRLGNGLIGSQVLKADGSDASVIVAANGGSDLVYVPTRRAAIVERVVNLLLTFDYVDGIFVDEEFGAPPGTLPLSAINMVGSTRLPRPAVVVALKVFNLTVGDIQTAVQVSDTSYQHGQGMHGGFGRDSTFNNMAALGPDFKTAFVDEAPIGNADIVPTLAQVMRFPFAKTGRVPGRVITEALTGSPPGPAPPMQYQRSSAAGDRQTVLLYKEYGGVRYLHTGCIVVTTTPDREACR